MPLAAKNSSQARFSFSYSSTRRFTNSQRIFRADVQGGQAVVTTLVVNANEDTTLFNITLSGDKGTVALLSRQATTTTLYVLPVAGGAPLRPVHTFDELEVRILQFQ